MHPSSLDGGNYGFALNPDSPVPRPQIGKAASVTVVNSTTGAGAAGNATSLGAIAQIAAALADKAGGKPARGRMFRA